MNTSNPKVLPPRNKVHDTHLRSIILRLDFQGVSDYRTLVNLFDKSYPKKFKSRAERYHQQVDFSLREEDIKQISEVLSIPVRVLERQSFLHYEDMVDVKCKTMLDISQFYICMTIVADKNYEGFDKYSDCFKGAISLFKSKVSYFQPVRLGLRKTRVEFFDDMTNVNQRFASFVFPNNHFGLDQTVRERKEYRDYLTYSEEYPAMFNILRKLEPAQKQGESKFGLLSTLDIDTYFQDSAFLQKRDITTLINDLNEKEYEAYFSCLNNNKENLDNL